MKALFLLFQKLWPRLSFFKSRSKFKVKVTKSTRHVFVKHGCPRRQQSRNLAKIYKSYIFTLPHSQGHGMSVKCEKPLDELTVQVWLLYLHPNFSYWTLFVSGTELRTDRQTDGRTDDPITRCPRRTFQAGGIKMLVSTERSCHKEYTCVIFKLYLLLLKSYGQG